MSDKQFNVESLQIAAQLRGKKPGGHFPEYIVVESRDVTIICGAIYGDNRFADGTVIHTSWAVDVDKENGVLETRNTVFTLGDEVTKETDSETFSRFANVLF